MTMKAKLLLSLFLVMSVVNSASALSVTIDGIRYKLNPVNMTATLAAIKSSTGENLYMNLDKIIIPKEIHVKNMTYTVTKIGDEAFKDCSNLSEIVIPNSVTEIGVHAFEDCKNLKNITIPSSVTEIKYQAFVGSGLTDVTFEASPIQYVKGGEFSSTFKTPFNTLIIGKNAFQDTYYREHGYQDIMQAYNEKQKAGAEKAEQERKQQAIKDLAALKQKIGTTTFNNLNSGIITKGMKWSSIMAFCDYINKYQYVVGLKIIYDLPDEVKISGVLITETISNAYGTTYSIGFTNRNGFTFSGGYIKVENGVVTLVNLERK